MYFSFWYIYVTILYMCYCTCNCHSCMFPTKQYLSIFYIVVHICSEQWDFRWNVSLPYIYLPFTVLWISWIHCFQQTNLGYIYELSKSFKGNFAMVFITKIFPRIRKYRKYKQTPICFKQCYLSSVSRLRKTGFKAVLSILFWILIRWKRFCIR